MKYFLTIFNKTNNEKMKINTTNLDKAIKKLQKTPTLEVLKIQRFQKIRCPECGKIIDAVSEWEKGMPFWSYVCECPHCQNIITESEKEIR